MTNKLSLGQKVQVTKSFTKEDLVIFANLSMDHNPIHIDPEYAQNSMFGGQVVHGALVSSICTGLMGMHLPGKGAIYLGQEFKYHKPIFVNEDVTAIVEVIDIREDKPIVKLSTICLNQKGELAVSGTATVLSPG